VHQRVKCPNVHCFQKDLILSKLHDKWHILDYLLSSVLGRMSVHIRRLTIIASTNILHCLDEQHTDGLTRQSNINCDVLQLLYLICDVETFSLMHFMCNMLGLQSKVASLQTYHSRTVRKMQSTLMALVTISCTYIFSCEVHDLYIFKVHCYMNNCWMSFMDWK